MCILMLVLVFRRLQVILEVFVVRIEIQIEQTQLARIEQGKGNANANAKCDILASNSHQSELFKVELPTAVTVKVPAS